LLLAVLIGAISLLFGYRAQFPSPALRGLMLSPEKRPTTAMLFFLRDMSVFVDPGANQTLAYSRRYGERLLTLETFCWAFGIASIVLVIAIYAGWAFFDITTIGAWSFFKEDVSATGRAVHAITAVIPLLLFVALAAEERFLTYRFFGGSDVLFAFVFRMLFAGWLLLHVEVYINNGLLILAAGALVLVSESRGFALGLIAAGFCAIVAGYMGDLGPVHHVLIAFILVSTGFTLVSFATTVAVYAALRWYDAGNLTILFSLIGLVLFAMVCAYVTPIVMVFLLFGVMTVTPESVHADWVNTVGVFREGGLQAATMLAIACMTPLLPPAWYLGRGLGALLARFTPVMPRLIDGLKNGGSTLALAEVDTLFGHYRRAHFLGYAAGAVVTLTFLTLAVTRLAQVLTVPPGFGQ